MEDIPGRKGWGEEGGKGDNTEDNIGEKETSKVECILMEESSVWIVRSVNGMVGRVLRYSSMSVTWSMGVGIA